MTADDIEHYRRVERMPVRGSYRGYDIVSMPPPSSGGVSSSRCSTFWKAIDLGHQDVGQHGASDGRGDEARLCGSRAVPRRPRHGQGAGRGLISKDYAAHWRATIDPDARHAGERDPRRRHRDAEGHNTTHFSVVDSFGNAVSNTYTLNFSYGVGLVAEGTGVLLNNELDDFAAKPDAPNAYGLIGYEANAPGPGKRPLSSMTPTIVLKDGKPFLVTGSPGGSRIITAVLQVVVRDRPRHGYRQRGVAPRIHNQWMPDQVFAEPGVSPDLIAALQARGDKVVPTGKFTSVNSVLVTPDGLAGAADPRTRGGLAVGY